MNAIHVFIGKTICTEKLLSLKKILALKNYFHWEKLLALKKLLPLKNCLH